MERGILSGLRILDFTWVLAGPYATRILADFGAEVIKVQSRKVIPGPEANLSGYFNTWNRNKRSVTLDLSGPEARDLILRLTALSDVVMENFSPRVMASWGLDCEKLRAVKPDLIMVSLSGMGQPGPWKDFTSFGSTVQALSGLTYLTSFLPDTPLGPGYSYADIVAGLYGALAVLAALESRDKTGQGEYIDLAEYEALCSFLGPALLQASQGQEEVLPLGNSPGHLPAAPYGCYRCRGGDRWCVIAVFREEEWQGLGRALGHPAWVSEERFSTLAERKRNSKELDELLEGWTLQRTPGEAVRLLQGAGVPAGIVQNAEDLSRDPQLRARDYFVHLTHPVLGPVASDRFPVLFEGASSSGWKSAPLLGEDNRYVFMELLGLEENDFLSLVEKGVIR